MKKKIFALGKPLILLKLILFKYFGNAQLCFCVFSHFHNLYLIIMNNIKLQNILNTNSAGIIFNQRMVKNNWKKE